MPAADDAPRDPADGASANGAPREEVSPGSGIGVGGYRLTDDDTHTWIAPDRRVGAWYALRIPNGWLDEAPLPGYEMTLRSDGQARSVLTVQRLAVPGPLTVAAATALLTAHPGRRLTGGPERTVVAGCDAVRLRAVEAGPPVLAHGVLVVQVGPERVVVTTATDDLTGAELGLVDYVALGDLRLRWLP